MLFINLLFQGALGIFSMVFVIAMLFGICLYVNQGVKPSEDVTHQSLEADEQKDIHKLTDGAARVDELVFPPINSEETSGLEQNAVENEIENTELNLKEEEQGSAKSKPGIDKRGKKNTSKSSGRKKAKKESDIL